MTALERAQNKVLAHEDLFPYRGRWVALRDGHVVVSDIDPGALCDHPDVQEDDILMPVPTYDTFI